AVRVGVVAEYPGGRHREGDVRAGPVRVVGRHGGGEREGDGSDVGVGLAVVGLVGEAVGAGVIGGRGVGEAAVGVERETAVAGAAYHHRRQGVPVHVRVVAEHAGGRHREGDVRAGPVGVVG